MKVCGCGRETMVGNGNCVICRGTIERGFCGSCFGPLSPKEDGNWECATCQQVYYAAMPEAREDAAPEGDEIEEETRPFNPELPEETKTQEDDEMR
ncbi:MAG: hypothetical protein M0Z48_00460 [Nitrospiraceae bacterium]|nr:hypothetical protein [Nitrospiraceae bacterium]